MISQIKSVYLLCALALCGSAYATPRTSKVPEIHNPFSQSHKICFKVEEVSNYTLSEVRTDFFEKFGDGENRDLPLLLKGIAKDWPVMKVVTESILLQRFGKTYVPTYPNWGTEFNSRIIFPFSDHLESVLKDPNYKGYLLESCAPGKYLIDPEYPNCTVNENTDVGPDEGEIRGYVCSALEKLVYYPKSSRKGLWVLFHGLKTVTPFHKHTRTFLIQLRGKKKAYLAHPRFDLEKCGGIYCQHDPKNLNPDLHPHLRGVQLFETEVGAGDMLFIPDDWLHHIEAVDAPSVSLSYFDGEDQN